MMKIGLLTFHRAINYGAVLQCYALYRTLSDLGHDVEVIDYRPAYIEKYRKLLSFSLTKNIFTEIKGLLRDCLLYGRRKTAIENFDRFLSMMNYSPIVRESQEIAAQKYDVVLSGSDQVWNRHITGGTWDKFYWGQFKHPNTLFASYAASFGGSPTKEMDGDIKGMLQKVDAISVREKDMADYLRPLGMNVSVCVDPTILVDEKVFSELAIEPADSNFILVYALKDRTKVVEWAKKLQANSRMKIIVLGGNVSSKTNYGKGIKVVQGISPHEFLGYFKKADVVVNASFHGTVFSTLFRKNFYSIEVGNSGRYKQYLESTGLSCRFLTLNDSPSQYPVDYSHFEEMKSSMVKASVVYLKALGI